KAVCIENLLKRMAGVDVKPYEVEALTKDGKKIPFEVNAQRITYKGKKADMVIFRDISERKRIQEKLKESKKTLADIIENSPIPMFVIDKNHQVTHWNQALSTLTAISPDKIIGTSNHWQAFYHQKRPLIADLVVDGANEKTIGHFYDGKYKKSIIEHSFEAEDYFPHMKKQGKWLHFSASPLKDKQGNIVGAIEMLQDITERKQVQQKEKKLLEKSLFLSKTADELNRFSVKKDIFNYITKRIEEIAGDCLVVINTFDMKTHQFSIQQAVGYTDILKKISGFLKIDLTQYSTKMDSPKYSETIKKGTLQKISRQEFKEMILPNFPRGSYTFANKILNLDQIYAMGLEEKGKVFGGLIVIANNHAVVENKDIIETFCNQAAVAMQRNTAMKELSEMNQNLEEKVKKRTERIEKLLKQKDQFVNQLGHDLKNPLGPLTNLIPLVKKHTPNHDDKKMLEVAERNVGYMRNLVDKTLELARLNSPHVNIQFEPVNLHILFNQIIDTNHYLFEDQGIAVEQHIPEDISIVGDTLRLEELFTNLLNNSVKYSPNGGVIQITAKKDAERVTISVADEGIGMNEEEINQIFDEFYKADGSRHDFDSSGLGMPICKRIVEIHNGRIWVESPGHGKGSTFYVTLPLNQKQKQQPEKPFESSQKYETITEKIDSILQ
ncbi:MAG: PAS domain-containing sensor histidine kinase, partial [Thermoplasmatota archaeon]